MELFETCIQYNGSLGFKQFSARKIDFTPNAVNSVDANISLVGNHETSSSSNRIDVETINTILYGLLVIKHPKHPLYTLNV